MSTFCFALLFFYLGKVASVEEKPYGSWSSPITSKLVAEGQVTIPEDLALDNQGQIFWSEVRSKEGGRYVINSYKPWNKSYHEWNPPGFSAWTRAHQYGGGAFFISKIDNTLFFSNFEDNRLYKMTKPGETPQPVTEDNKDYVYADGIYVPQVERIIIMREDHTGMADGSVKENVNTIVSINPTTMKQQILVSGSDFYSTPRVSPDGKKLVWTQWKHPNMPWDDTEIYMGTLNRSGDSLVPSSIKKVAGGAGISANFPSWSPDGQVLFISDQDDGWWNLFLYNESVGCSTNLKKSPEEIGIAQWEFGRVPYTFLRGPLKGKIATTYSNDLGVLNMKTKAYEKFDLGQLKTLKGMVATHDGLLYIVAAGPTQFRQLIQVDILSKKIKTIKYSNISVVDEAYISVPEYISFPTADNSTIYGYLYKPKNKDYKAPEGTLPPLLVRGHQGPTLSANSHLNLNHQYMTSRGFVILDLDYRGSTGHGRAYRKLLYSNWGVYDLEDVCYGAEYLLGKGIVNSDQVCIDGESAGGYTTLATLTFKKTFKAGVSKFGVSDLIGLRNIMHKFESRYLDNLVGPYPEAEAVYKERSPIDHTDQLDKPLALFQGTEDKIVSPDQAIRMFEAVKAKGLPTALVLYEGEGHGFNVAAHIQETIDGEFYFFAKLFGFDTQGYQVNMTIYNLPK